MNILLHACCGPCSIYPVDAIRAEGFNVTGHFFNPNIHPYKEWEQRKVALEEYARSIKLDLLVEEEYLLEEFLRGVVHREQERCAFCYDLRLRRTAELAKERGFDCYSSTLLVSPYQKHELIRETGVRLGEEVGIPFYYLDFRPGYREATQRSRELEMYRQKYCGCIYSEKERFYKAKKTTK